MRFTLRRSTSTAAQPASLETPEILTRATPIEPAADIELKIAAEPKLATVPRPALDSKTVPLKAAAEPKPAAQSKPAAELKPAVEPKPSVESEWEAVRVPPKDDATQIKESVYEYVALLNAGDVTARANCYLSEFTSFGIEGGPLVSNRFERRFSGPISTFDLRCRDLRVYVHKDTAIVTAYLIGTVTNVHGAPTRVTSRSSWVHLRQNGEWKIAHSHLSPLDPEA
jgi:ketosteroid isomerase-like protein